MNGKSWLAEEIASLRDWYGRVPAVEIAKRLDRTPRAVWQMAGKLGLVKKRHASPGLIEMIRDKHPLGWSDRELATEYNRRQDGIQVDRRWVCDVRRQLGLPNNAYSEHRRQAVAAKTKEQLAKAGLRSIGQLRAVAFQKFAERNGWPADLRPRAVQILTLLYEQGPKTRREIADAIGMPWKGSRKSLVSNDPEGSYLANLVARGLVVQLPPSRPISRGIEHDAQESFVGHQSDRRGVAPRRANLSGQTAQRGL